MAVTVRLPASLRSLVGGSVTLSVEDVATVADVLDHLAVTHPALERRLRDERGTLRPHVNLFAGGDNIRDLEGTATALDDGSELTILPAVSGGSGRSLRFVSSQDALDCASPRHEQLEGGVHGEGVDRDL
jgi:molybdopterin converting factor small subunit